MAEALSVSALICVRDGEAHLAQAIDSVLAQTSPADELIVVEDGSTDDTAGVARSYSPAVSLLQPPPRGLGAARNVAVEASTRELVAFLDHDDIWEPEKLELQRAAFAADPALDFCFTFTREFADPGLEGEVSVRPEPVPGAMVSTLCARREAIGRAGGFELGVRTGELLGWLLRARELGMRERTLPEVLVRRRVHATNTTRQADTFGDFAQVIKATLDRRRQQA
jgi:glycosyltransferase involved in cell wall biosynthesis